MQDKIDIYWFSGSGNTLLLAMKLEELLIYSFLLSLVSRSHKMKSLYQKLIPVIIDSDQCISCGLCVRLCPVNHLSMSFSSYPEATGDSCIHCQRCYSYCPVEAISIGNKNNIPYRALTAGEFQNQLNRRL